MSDQALFKEVAAEGVRAKRIHGQPADRSGLIWLAILAEEFGEAAKEVVQGEIQPLNRVQAEYLARLRSELVQVASVTMRWLAQVDHQYREAYSEDYDGSK